MTGIRATPFHAGAAEANRFNRWTGRNGFTLAESYEDPSREAMAARFGVVIADISWRWRAMLEGERAGELAARLFTRDTSALAPGDAVKALWLSDAGGVRGAGVVARFGKRSFLLASAAGDAQWIAAAAELFGVTMLDMTERQGGLAIIGPYARSLVEELGLDAALAPLSFAKLFWRGLDVTVSRFGEHGGFEIWCGAEDGQIVWNRIRHAGARYGVQPAGVDALDILDIEAGIARPGRDYEGARGDNDVLPLAGALRLQSLIDADHRDFNGRTAALAANASQTLVGVELGMDRPAPFVPLVKDGVVVGQTLSSCHSHALRRGIALAQVDNRYAANGTLLALTPASTRDALQPAAVAARIVDLPFLPIPDQISP